jgi:hypothetical protein
VLIKKNLLLAAALMWAVMLASAVADPQPGAWDFSDGLTNWVTSGDGSWSVPAGQTYAVLSYGSTTPPLPPSATALLTTDFAAVAGNYRAAGITHVGFEFEALQAAPNTLILRLVNNSGPPVEGPEISLHPFTPATNFVYRLLVPVTSRSGEYGTWFGGVSEDFDESLSDIIAIQLELRPQALGFAQSFRVCQFLLESVPQRAGMAWLVGGGLEMTWEPLISNRAYKVESTTNLLAETEWDLLDRVTVEFPFFVDPDAGDHPFRAYRLTW